MTKMTKARIEEVIRTTATISNEADFMLTHMPFKALVDYVKPVDDTSKAHYLIDNKLYTYAAVFDEQTLLDDMLEDTDKHKFIMIQGKNGSGKSHLVRWLYYNYKKSMSADSEICIFIPRAHNTLKDTIKDILSAGILSEEREKVYLDKVQGGASGMSEAEFLEMIYAIITIIVKNDKNLEPKDKLPLYKYLSDEVVKEQLFLKKNGPIEKLCKKMNGKLSEEEGNPFIESEIAFPLGELIPKLNSANHKAEKDVLIFAQELTNSLPKKKTICQYLNSQVELVMQRSSSFQGSDLKDVFAEIRKELRDSNKSMALFIEDINSFTGIDSAIIEVLIQDHEEFPELCRLTSVIGSTDYFFDKFHDSLKERLTRNVVILETALLSNEDWIVEFAARYINAINLTMEDSQKWLQGNDNQIPIWECDYRFSDVSVNGVTMSVFPFTRRALVNLYNLLPNSSRTPRCFLRDVIKHVELKWVDIGIKLINSEMNFRNESISSLGMFATEKDSAANDVNLPEESEKRGVLLKVWGDKSFKKDLNGNLGAVDKEIFEFFGVAVLDDISNEVVETPTKNHDTGTKQPKEPNANAVLNEKLLNIEQWGNGSCNEFKLHREARECVGKFLLRTINWDKEDIPYDIANSVLKELSAIYIEGQPVSGNGIIQIERNNESVRLLKALFSQNNLAKGKGWDYSSGSEDQVFANAWLLKHKREVVKRVRSASLGNVDIEYACIKACLCEKLLNGEFGIKSSHKYLEDIFRPTTLSNASEKGEKWCSLREEVGKNRDSLSEMLSVLFRTVIGESDVKNSKYVYIDAVKVLSVVDKVTNEGILSKPGKMVDISLEGRPGGILSALKLFFNNVDECYDEELMLYNRAKSKLTPLFGEKISETIVKSTFSKIYEYLQFIRNDINRPFDPSEFKMLDVENTKEFLGLVKNVSEMSKENDKEKCMIIMSTHNTQKMSKYMSSFLKFEQFMQERNSNFNADIDKKIDKEISGKKNSIVNAIKECIMEEQYVN